MPAIPDSRCHFRVDPDFRRLLVKVASQEGLSLSELLRVLVADGLRVNYTQEAVRQGGIKKLKVRKKLGFASVLP